MADRFKCGCGSNIVKYGITRHIKTNKHQKWLNQPKECGVCYETQDKFVECRQCHNTLCTTCIDRLVRKRCPYCRFQFSQRGERQIDPYSAHSSLISFFHTMRQLDSIRQREGAEPSRFVQYLERYIQNHL